MLHRVVPDFRFAAAAPPRSQRSAAPPPMSRTAAPGPDSTTSPFSADKATDHVGQDFLRRGQAGSSTGAGSESANPRGDLQRSTLVHQRQDLLRNTRSRPPARQSATKVCEAGKVGRCQALWTLAQEERYRPIMIVNALALTGMLAAACAMFVVAWGSRRHVIPGIQ